MSKDFTHDRITPVSIFRSNDISDTEYRYGGNIPPFMGLVHHYVVASFIEPVRKEGKAAGSVITSGSRPHAGRQWPAGSEVITAARDPPRPLTAFGDRAARIRA